VAVTITSLSYHCAGYFVARQGDLFTTARELGAVVMVLAALALVGTLRRTSGESA